MEIELFLSDMADPTGDSPAFNGENGTKFLDMANPTGDSLALNEENGTQDFHSGLRITQVQLSFQPGQIVWAKYRGEDYLPGSIVSTSGNKCEVQWDNGSKSDNVNCMDVIVRVARNDTPKLLRGIDAVNLFNRNAQTLMSQQPFTPSRLHVAHRTFIGPKTGARFIQAEMLQRKQEIILCAVFYACGLPRSWGVNSVYNVNGSAVVNASLEELQADLLHLDSQWNTRKLVILSVLLINFNVSGVLDQLTQNLLRFYLEWRDQSISELCLELTSILSSNSNEFCAKYGIDILNFLSIRCKFPADAEKLILRLLQLGQECQECHISGSADYLCDVVLENLRNHQRKLQDISEHLEAISKHSPCVQAHIIYNVAEMYTVEQQMQVTTFACTLEAKLLRQIYALEMYCVQKALWKVLQYHAAKVLYWEAHTFPELKICVVKWATNIKEYVPILTGRNFQALVASMISQSECRHVFTVPIFNLQELFQGGKFNAKNEGRANRTLKEALSNVSADSVPVSVYCSVNAFISNSTGTKDSFEVLKGRGTIQFKPFLQSNSEQPNTSMSVQTTGILSADASVHLYPAETFDTLDIDTVSQWDKNEFDRGQASFDVFGYFPNTKQSSQKTMVSLTPQHTISLKLTLKRLDLLSTRALYILYALHCRTSLKEMLQTRLGLISGCQPDFSDLGSRAEMEAHQNKRRRKHQRQGNHHDEYKHSEADCEDSQAQIET